MKKTIIIALMAILPFGAFAQKFGHINSSIRQPRQSLRIFRNSTEKSSTICRLSIRRKRMII